MNLGKLEKARIFVFVSNDITFQLREDRYSFLLECTVHLLIIFLTNPLYFQINQYNFQSFIHVICSFVIPPKKNCNLKVHLFTLPCVLSNP